MRQIGAVGLTMLAVVAGAFSGSAAATELTSPAGTKVQVGATIKAVAEGPIEWWMSPAGMSCSNSELEAEVANAGGSGSTVSLKVTNLTFTNCGQEPGSVTDTVWVHKPGTLELHNNGTLTWDNGEITALLHRGSGFFKWTAHCLFKTEKTDLGLLTGSNATNGTATLDVESVPIAQYEQGLCGKTLNLTGSYKITSPDFLQVD
jgi:hypothetical protein